MRYNEIYRDLYPRYSAKFERRNLDFDKHFGHAFNTSYANGDRDFKEQIIKTLDGVLAAYVSSESKTDGGSFLRKVGRIALIVLPFLKYVKIKR